MPGGKYNYFDNKRRLDHIEHMVRCLYHALRSGCSVPGLEKWFENRSERDNPFTHEGRKAFWQEFASGQTPNVDPTRKRLPRAERSNT